MGRCAELAIAALFIALPLPAFAQESQSLAQQARNPFADLVNLQFFYDANLGVAPANNTQQVLTVQPLIPFDLNSDWIVVTRTILPLITQPGSSPGERWVHGLGDTQVTALVSPSRVDSLDWGIGAALQLPTAASEPLGQGKWGAGPAAGVQWTGKQWTLSVLALNIWSFAGDSNRPSVNEMQLQPTATYNFQSHPDRYLSFAPTITADWTARGDERWTVPLSLAIGQLFKFGHQSVNLQAAAYYNVIAPSGSAQWTLELLAQFLFPETTIDSGQVKQQQLGAHRARERERGLGAEGNAVAGAQLIALNVGNTAGDVQPAVAIRRERMADCLLGLQVRHQQARILVNLERAIRAIAISDDLEAIAPLRARKLPLLVARLDAEHFRHEPHLQEVHGLCGAVIELAVRDAAAGRHALHLARTNHRRRSEAVAMRERAGHHVGDDLHVAMTVLGKAAARDHAIVIDDAQAAKPHVVWVSVFAK